MNLLRLLQTIDRRYLYALLILTVVLPFFMHIQLPVAIEPATEDLYDAVEALPRNSFVLLAVDWSAGTRGENGQEQMAIMRHLMRRHLRFGMIDFADPQGKQLGEEMALQLEKQFGYKEGVNWVNFGYQIDMADYLKSFVLNVPAQVKTDIHSTPIADLPVMRGIHTMKDIPLLIDITPSGSYQTFIQFVQGPYHNTVKMGVALTAIMAPEAFNYLDSHQLAGIVPGLTGAAEYEARYAQEYDPSLVKGSKVTQYSNSSSFAHLLIIALVIMGNVAMVLERRQNRPGRRGAH